MYLYDIQNRSISLDTTFRSFARIPDANLLQLSLDSTALCPFTVADNITKTFQFSNAYITCDNTDYGKSIGFLFSVSQKSDLAKRTLNIIFANVTMEHFSSNIIMFQASSTNPIFRIDNVTTNNITQISPQNYHFQLSGSNTVLITRFRMYNSNTQARIVFFMPGAPQVYVYDWIFMNNTLDYNANTFCIMKCSSGRNTTVITLSNLYFANNVLHSNMGFQQDIAIQKYRVINSTFVNESISSETQYFAIFKSQSIEFSNVTFKDIKYNDDIKAKTYLIRYDQLSLTNSSISSIIKDVRVITSEVNFLLFKGYALMPVITTLNSTNFFDITNLMIDSNFYESQNQILTYEGFTFLGNVKMRIINSTFQNINFLSGGYIIYSSQNTIRALDVINSTFTNIDRGQIQLQSGDSNFLSTPTRLNVYNCSFLRNRPILDALFRISTNTKLMVYDSLFNETYSTSRGSIILADFRASQADFINCNFTNNFAKYGGVFYTHFESSLTFQKCLFLNNSAYQASIGNVENEGFFNIQDSIIQDNYASHSILFSISDSQTNFSKLSNVTIRNNQQVSTKELLNLQPDFIHDELVHFENESTEAQQTVTSTISIKKSSLEISNGTYIQNSKNFMNSYFGNISYDYMENINPQYLLETNLESNIQMDNTSFSTLNIQLFDIVKSSIQLSGSTISNVTFKGLNNRLIRIDSSSVNLQNCTIQDIISPADFLVEIKRSEEVKFNQTIIKNYNTNFLESKTSNIEIFSSKFSKNIYQGNYAPYGLNIAGYTLDVKVISYTQIAIASSQLYQGTILVNVVDEDGKLVTNDQTSTCISGEVSNQNKCQICDQGLYSLFPSSQVCYDCPKNAECNGGFNMSLNKGYWRSQFYSSKVIQCFNENACKGGQLNDPELILSGQVESYDQCSQGYTGNLCSICKNENGTQYSRFNNYECFQCPSKLANSLKIIGIFFAVLIGLGVIIWVNLRSEKESQTSVVLRIFLSYIQIVTSTAAFNLSWPKYLQNFFGMVSTVGEAAESTVSLDCFIYDYGLSEYGISIFYIKISSLAVVPLIMPMIFVVIFLVIKLFKRLGEQTYKRYVIVASITTLNAVHPTITKLTTGLFYCMELEDNEFWLNEDLEIRCWQPEHIAWAIGLGIPLFLIWIVGFPLLGLIYLYKRRLALQDPMIFSRFRILYQGLKNEYFYWDFLNLSIKTFVAFTNVYLNLQPDIFKSLVVLLVIALFLQYQKKTQPYKNPLINQLEYNEYMTILVTFFGSLFFVQDEIDNFIRVLAFVVIIIFNVKFLVLWIYCLIQTFKRYRFVRQVSQIMRMLILSRDEKKLEQEFTRTSESQVFNQKKKAKINTIQNSSNLYDFSDKKESEQKPQKKVIKKQLKFESEHRDQASLKTINASIISHNKNENRWQSIQKPFEKKKSQKNTKIMSETILQPGDIFQSPKSNKNSKRIKQKTHTKVYEIQQNKIMDNSNSCQTNEEYDNYQVTNQKQKKSQFHLRPKRIQGNQDNQQQDVSKFNQLF
eukprot:403331357